MRIIQLKDCFKRSIAWQNVCIVLHIWIRIRHKLDGIVFFENEIYVQNRIQSDISCCESQIGILRIMYLYITVAEISKIIGKTNSSTSYIYTGIYFLFTFIILGEEEFKCNWKVLNLLNLACTYINIIAIADRVNFNWTWSMICNVNLFLFLFLFHFICVWSECGSSVFDCVILQSLRLPKVSIPYICWISHTQCSI